MKMQFIREKFGRRKVAVVLLLVSLVTFAAVYAFIQTKSGLAVLTSPPPGIPGPYYVTTEAKIYGPVVDLATIKSKMSGTYASDYTYVQWGTNPFYRVYVDNTLQEVYYGQLTSVMDRFGCWDFPIESSLKSTFDNLKITGALDPTAILGNLRFSGNMPGVMIAYDSGQINVGSPAYPFSATFVTNTTGWYAAQAHLWASGDSGSWSNLRLSKNDTSLVYLSRGGYLGELTGINATGGGSGNYEWELYGTMRYSMSYRAGAAVYLKDMSKLQTSIPSSNIRVYNITDTPGTGFVSKYISPSSPVAGSVIEVTVRLDPPVAERLNITDVYPNSFTWPGAQVTLKSFRVGVGLLTTRYVSVTPVADGSNMKFTVTYDQATDILQSLLGDEYVYMSYTLIVPSNAGEYTLPAATMSYSIPIPQT